MHPVCLLLEKPRQAVQYNEWKFTVSTLQLPLVGLLVLLLCYTCLTASFQDNLGSWKHNIKPFWVLLQQQDMMEVGGGAGNRNSSNVQSIRIWLHSTAPSPARRN